MSQPDPNQLHVIKRGRHIEIHDISDDELGPAVVYEGNTDVDSILEAVALHFGFEGVQDHVLEEESTEDPLGLGGLSTDDLDTTEPEPQIIEGENGEEIEVPGDPSEGWRAGEEELGVPQWDEN